MGQEKTLIILLDRKRVSAHHTSVFSPSRPVSARLMRTVSHGAQADGCQASSPSGITHHGVALLPGSTHQMALSPETGGSLPIKSHRNPEGGGTPCCPHRPASLCPEGPGCFHGSLVGTRSSTSREALWSAHPPRPQLATGVRSEHLALQKTTLQSQL